MRSRRPASNVGPCPARTGCTTNSYSSISPRSANASGSVTPPTHSPSPGSCLSRCTLCPRSPCTSSAFQSTPLSVLDTTYFCARSMVSANGLVGLRHLDHRLLTALGVEAVALAGEVLLLLEQGAPGGGPLLLRDDLRQA